MPEPKELTPEELAAKEAADKAPVTAADLAKLSADTDAKFKKLTDDSAKAMQKSLKDFGTSFATSTTESMKALLTEALKGKETDTVDDGKNKGGDPETIALLKSKDARLAALEERFKKAEEDGNKARANAERTDRESQIRAALSKAGLTDNLELAFRGIRDDIFRDPDDPQSGKLYGPDTTDFGEYVTTFVEKNQALLPARSTNPTGATSANSGNRGKVVTLEDIKPGNTPEENARINAAIRDALSGGSAFVQ